MAFPGRCSRELTGIRYTSQKPFIFKVFDGYFLVSVKERNMDEFIATLQKDKRRHAEQNLIKF